MTKTKRQDILAMAPKELDAFLAVRVMGFERCEKGTVTYDEHEDGNYVVQNQDEHWWIHPWGSAAPFCPSAQWQSLGELIDKMRELGFERVVDDFCDGRVNASWIKHGDVEVDETVADKSELIATCRAAALAVAGVQNG